ncbi:ECF RNA polymerase sigma factor SigW [Bacillus sp. THAF10]|uniref:sigma-70 family RNA polymerase sigma factor n=1 Tax=Bacillus sp. THAF10 TaxID=2587848 RepID=UPI001269622C|nr:sigma-70 family RNA polymerase sigma factor [Bacillus sp. THAF10]QFT91058.1 ECF RNA polymerase sigma factor SigW [Bacillus sp. THAF10]
MKEKERDFLLEKAMVEYGDQLTRLAYSYVKDADMAKDLVQNTFIKCYTTIETFRHESTLKTWLYRITINECKDYLKSWSYKKFLLLELYNSNNNSSLSPEEVAIKNWEKGRVKSTIFSLPPKYREIIFLYYYEELTMEEISTLLGLPISTVKTRIRRGKDRLKQTIERKEINE